MELPKKRYKIIYVDPPWKIGLFSKTVRPLQKKFPYSECKRKLDLLKVWNIPVCNCVWRERIGDHVIARYWDIETIRKFRTYDCRKHNQIIKFQIDPELK